NAIDHRQRPVSTTDWPPRPGSRPSSPAVPTACSKRYSGLLCVWKTHGAVIIKCGTFDDRLWSTASFLIPQAAKIAMARPSLYRAGDGTRHRLLRRTGSLYRLDEPAQLAADGHLALDRLRQLHPYVQ